VTLDRPAVCRTMQALDDRALEHVADYFRALSEPHRLKILNALRAGERNVGDLAEVLDCSQANVSKHLSVLTKLGFIERHSRGTSAYYRVADPGTYQLCDLVCGQIARRFVSQADMLSAFTAAGAATAGAARRSPGSRRKT
jgi:DNA-binding transcriptional ArsR family regulator